MKPIVAVIGRPNVGKSTFFNRVTGSRNALVDDAPGVTRDRLCGDVVWDDIGFTLVDTGGFLEQDADAFAPLIRDQIRQAVADADALILLLDGKNGLSPFDMDLLELLRGQEKPVFYAVNKIDGPEREADLAEFYRLGIENLYPVSAAHGYGVGSFLDDLTRSLGRMTLPADDGKGGSRIRLSVVGRPNVGKSSLINRILLQNRLLVSDVPGTTRDAVDLEYDYRGRSYLFVDTAGIRRKSRVTERIEKFSVIKSLRSLDRCDVALIVLDAGAGVTEQDIKIAGYAHERGCACIFLLNKWDLVPGDRQTAKKFRDELRFGAKFLGFAPILTVSARTGLRVRKIFELVDAVFQQYSTRIGTGPLNRIIERAVENSPPPFHRGRRLKFYYATQVSSGPPTFVCFVNYPEAVHFSYKRYLLNQIRTEAALDRTPLRLIFRPRDSH